MYAIPPAPESRQDALTDLCRPIYLRLLQKESKGFGTFFLGFGTAFKAPGLLPIQSRTAQEQSKICAQQSFMNGNGSFFPARIEDCLS
jgi:hypothetical protein